jgi:hypothetical protein
MSFRTGRDDVVPCGFAPDATDRMQLQLLQISPTVCLALLDVALTSLLQLRFGQSKHLAVFNADFIPFRLPPLRVLFTFSSNCAHIFHVSHHNASPLHPESNPTKFTTAFHFFFHLLTNFTSQYELSHRTR